MWNYPLDDSKLGSVKKNEYWYICQVKLGFEFNGRSLLYLHFKTYQPNITLKKAICFVSQFMSRRNFVDEVPCNRTPATNMSD